MRERIEVQLVGTVRHEMRIAALAAAPNETGGLLLGWWNSLGHVVIRHAVEVPDSSATRSSWTRRERPAKRALARALNELDHPLLGYVGDWHVHPEQCSPSGRDQTSIVETSRQFNNPIVMAVRLPDGSVELLAARRGFVINAKLQGGDRRARGTNQII